MTDSERDNSIEAVQACMAYLNLAPDSDEPGTVSSRMTEANGKKLGVGRTIAVRFKNAGHAHRGPWIEFEYLVRGYGLHQETFTPQACRFSWDADNGVLHGKHEKSGDSFTLHFGE